MCGESDGTLILIPLSSEITDVLKKPLKSEYFTKTGQGYLLHVW